MQEFGYLSVLISIVLGLGIANLLTGLAALIRRRSNIEMYWPVPIWMVTLFLIHVQMWWAMFDLRKVEHWTFPNFLVVLMMPVLLFLMTALIVPDVPSGEIANLRGGYFREARPFFLIAVALLVCSLLRSVLISGALPEPPNLGMHLLFGALSSIAAVTKNDAYHRINAPIAFVLMVAYIGTLFANLQ